MYSNQKKSKMDEFVELSRWVKSCISSRLAWGCKNSIALYFKSCNRIMLSSHIWSYISPYKLFSVCRWLGLTQNDSRSSLYGISPISCTGRLRVIGRWTLLSVSCWGQFETVAGSGLNRKMARNWMFVTAEELIFALSAPPELLWKASSS